MNVGGPHCAGCPQDPKGVRLVGTDGTGSNGILIVGDSPWRDEVAAIRPFAGAAGAYLDRILRRLGCERDAFLIANSMWCKPPELGWTDSPAAYEAMRHCRPYLDHVIAAMQPKVIVALGNVALQRVCGVSGLKARHAYVHESLYGIPVVPTFHPSFVMQGNQKYSAAVFFAFRRAQEVARGEHQVKPVSYVCDDFQQACAYLGAEVRPSGLTESAVKSADATALMAAAKLPAPDWYDYRKPELMEQPASIRIKPLPLLIADIETPTSSYLEEDADELHDESYTIVRISFSHTPGTAVTMPWMEPYISLAKAALAAAQLTVFWNAHYDVPRLVNADCRIGEVHDAMWAWHFLQSDLPKGLGFVAPFYYDGPPWKQLAAGEPAWYSAVDSDATIRCYLGIKEGLMREGRWERWVAHCAKTDPLLQQMGKAGILIDQVARQSLTASLQAEYAAYLLRLQGQVPDEVKPRKHWKREPKDMTGVRRIEEPCACRDSTPVI